ncbi:alpha/beta-hydrolase [Trichoderma longibrachiatum ATCC 18648]|uniref:Alpha/beta-hydrolase n=1 Tax=Trichoderma longibrachiatum ATCC 18648 TaxID=983965 RepID=A0A2T4BRW4_TRILO|nr:alpha/beta-hydrolase [Trichoderma longibrachiatum ATCC 18648]
MASPGNLYVTMQPHPGLSLDQFHEWYNNEHGPTRLRIPQIFANGLRYRAADGKQPEFLAAYDVTDMALLETETYLTLRANRSPREAATIAQVDVARYFYDLVHVTEAPLFMPIEKLTDEEASGLVAVTTEISLKDNTPDAGALFEKWFVEEHVGFMSKIPGWLRSRLFKTSSLELNQPTKYLSFHDFAKDNGLAAAEQTAATDNSWKNDDFDKAVASRNRRTYSLFYTFGPAPRDLDPLSRLPESASFTSNDGKTCTIAGPNPVISSFITTKDSLSIPYRLEGNPSPDAPTIAFCNSLLTSLHMWDTFIAILKSHRPHLRILRYDTRGRHAIPQPPVSAALDTLADDLLTILDALRIPKLDTLVGVSMGGATALKFTLKYPSRLSKLIACDFNAASSPANTQAWKDRVAIAEQDSGNGIKTLADQTVARWFHPSSMENPDLVRTMTKMVAANDVEGFKHSCTALSDYDMKPDMPACPVPGLFVVGDGDAKGALVKAMDGFKGLFGPNGTQLKIVPNTGHLPMFENPQAFWESLRDLV